MSTLATLDTPRSREDVLFPNKRLATKVIYNPGPKDERLEDERLEDERLVVTIERGRPTGGEPR